MQIYFLFFFSFFSFNPFFHFSVGGAAIYVYVSKAELSPVAYINIISHKEHCHWLHFSNIPIQIAARTTKLTLVCIHTLCRHSTSIIFSIALPVANAILGALYPLLQDVISATRLMSGVASSTVIFFQAYRRMIPHT